MKDKIFILETPNEIEGYAAEIKLLKYNTVILTFRYLGDTITMKFLMGRILNET